jgi:hypothetical protein
MAQTMTPYKMPHPLVETVKVDKKNKKKKQK